MGHEDGVALATGALGAVLLAIGDHNAAKRACEEFLDICRRIGDRAKAAIALSGLGPVFRGGRRYSESTRLRDPSLVTV